MKSVRQLSLVVLSACLFASASFAQVTGGPGRGGPGGAPGPVYGSPVYRGNSPFPAQPNPPPRGNPNYGNHGNYGNPNYGNPNYGRPNYGNPVYRPPVHVQVYPAPVYPSYPPTYPTYPSYPNQNLGPCSINTTYNGSFAVYTVYDARGNVMITTPDYNQAYQVAMNTVAARQCSYVASNSPSTPNYCQVMPGQNAHGEQFYRVVDRAGRILLNTTSYSDAQREVQTNLACYQLN